MRQETQPYNIEKSPQIAFSRELLAERVNPRKYGYSPLLTGIVGLLIGHDYKFRDSHGGKLASFAYTSDGRVIAFTSSPTIAIYVGTISDFENNLSKLIADAQLSPDEFEFFSMLVESSIADWDSDWNGRTQ